MLHNTRNDIVSLHLRGHIVVVENSSSNNMEEPEERIIPQENKTCLRTYNNSIIMHTMIFA